MIDTVLFRIERLDFPVPPLSFFVPSTFHDKLRPDDSLALSRIP